MVLPTEITGASRRWSKSSAAMRWTRVDVGFETFGHYFFNQDLSTGIGVGNLNLAHDKYFRNQNVALDWNHTFKPRLINTAGMGFTRVGHHRGTTSNVGWESLNPAGIPGTSSA